MTQEARHELATTDGTDDVSSRDDAEALLRQLRAVDNVQPLLGDLLAALAALEDADKALLMRFDGDGTLTLVASSGLAPEHTRLLERLPASAHPWADALRAPVAIGDAEIEAAFTPQPLVRAAGVRGLHAVPILSPDGSPLGVIATLFRRPLQLSSRQERVAALYARQVSWILTSVQLREQAARAIDGQRERVNEAEQRARDTAIQAASAEARAAELQHRTEDLTASAQALEQRAALAESLALERTRLYDESLSARGRAQEAFDALSEERARVDTIVQQMPAGLLIAEAPSGKLVRGNEQLEHILRRPFIASPNIAAYAAWQFSSLSGVALLPEEFPLARSILHGERVVSESLRVTRGDGTRGFVMVSSTPILDRDGRIIAAVATVYDVTDQRQSEETLRFLAEASSILAASLDYEDTLPTIAKLAVPFLADACIIDVVGIEGDVRRVAAVHREASRADAVKAALRATPDPTAFHHPVVRALRTGMSDLFPEYPPAVRGPRPVNVPRVSADFPRISGEHLRADPYDFLGDLRPRSLIVVPLFARGRTRGAITLIIENDERRYGTQELSLAEEFARRAGLAVDNARLYQDAQVANHAKTDFLGVMSHELRTPLNAIIGYTELLLMGVPAPIPDSGRQQVERVRNASHHLLHLIDEVLAFSRLETGREELRPGSAQLSAVITEAASVIAPLAVERRLDLRIEAPSAPVTLETDVGKVRHILLNLLSNAVKFTDDGQIVLTARVEDGDVHFDVRDTGVGIPPQHHERIFDPFWQVENKASRRVAGTGIGLSVARRLARLLGGDVTVSSRPGEGSTFTARLPRKMGEAPAAEAAANGAHES